MIKIVRLFLLSLLFLSSFVQAQNYDYAKKFMFGSGPKGLDLHEQKLYVALYSASKIVVSSLDGTVLKEIPLKAKPYDVAVAGSDRLLVANRDAKNVTLISGDGTVLKTVAFNESVNGVTIRKDGNIFVATILAVHVFDNNLEPVTTIKTLSTDKFREVRKVFFDGADNMYFVDKNTGVIKISSFSGATAQVDFIIKKGNQTAPSSTTFNRLAYMTTTAKGDLIVSADEAYGNSLPGIYRFDRNGAFSDIIGTLNAGTSDDQIQAPYGIVADENDNLYVSDFKANAIKVWVASDKTAPIISDLSAGSEVRGQATFSFKTDEKCSVYYLLQAASLPAPSADEIRKNASVEVSTPENTITKSVVVTDPSPQMVYLLAVDAAGNESVIYTTKAFAVETKLLVSNLFVLNKTADGVTVEAETNDNGVFYWALTDAEATDLPSHEAIEQAPLSGNAVVEAGKGQLISISALEARRYKLCGFLKKGTEKTAVHSLLIMPADEAELIYQRYVELLKGNRPDYTDPLMLARYEALRANVAKARQKLPSYQWVEGMPPLDLMVSREGRDIAATVLLPLALNYHMEGPAANPNPDYLNPNALKEITGLYDYMEKRGMVEGCNIQFASSGSFLGMCGYFYASVLMREELLRSKQWAVAEAMMAWMSREVNPSNPEWGAEVEHNGSRSDGVRTLYHNRLMAICAQTDDRTNRENDLAYLQKALNQNMKIAPAWDGFIKPDFTGYHHHGPWGNAYNTDALHTSCQMAYVLRGTSFALNEQSIHNLAESLLAFRAYCGKYDISRGMCGRFPNQLTALSGNIPAFAYLYPVLAGEMQQRVGGAFDRLFTPEYSGVMQNTVRDVNCDIYFHGGLGMLQQMNKVKSLGLEDTEISAMNRTFPYSAMQVHRRGDWMAAVKSYTKYVWDFETNEEQNWLGRNQSAGALSIYATPDEEGVVTAAASGVGYNGWDWSHVPGTTSFDMPIDSIIKEATLYTMAKFSPSSIAGGVSLEGKHGVYGMIFNDIRQAYTYTGVKWGTKWRGVTLSANKSWFFFDDEIVALASEIRNTNPDYPAHTTLFQNTLASVDTPFYLNGEAKTGLDYAEDFSGNNPFVLTDVVGNAYLIPNGNGLHVHRKTQHSVQDRNYNNKTTGNYATAWLDHGKTTGGSYHYMIKVGGAEEAKQMSTLPELPYEIRQQDDCAHIVNYPAKSLRGYAVFKAGEIKNDVLLASADKPCMIMVREKSAGEMTLSLSNPELGFYPADKFPYQVWSIDKDKLYAESKEQPVIITLKGDWDLSAVSAGITHMGYDAEKDLTTLLFSGKDAESMEAALTRQAVSVEETTGEVAVSFGPNPFGDIFRIRFASEGSHTVVLADMTGRRVYQATHSGAEATIVTRNLMSGSYLLMIDGRVSGKVMKK
ncbi:MAG: chondroitinase family polysaccharide lyase [Bacteroidales bacterium]